MGCGGSSRRNSKKSGNDAAQRKKKISVRIGINVKILDTSPVVIFVFGGPGSKKGKLMSDLTEAFGFKLINIDRTMLGVLAKKMEISGSLDSVTKIADHIKVHGMFPADPLDPTILDLHVIPDLRDESLKAAKIMADMGQLEEFSFA
ncbi:uncharacterized protein LOC121381493 [Gigantopelta aegis]|uniref:uncharacterized protein LOC121381493 n=1 Tax=Gigantopelta aegis TaxID=1735272 RepID=UPI001B88D516|nr:uncharacterized protein LOC121381493 [Gigantopelta aegis]